MEQEEPNLHTTETTSLQHKNLKTIANEYNKRTGSNAITKKDKKRTKAFEENGNEITKAEMVNMIVAQNKAMSSQALRT